MNISTSRNIKNHTLIFNFLGNRVQREQQNLGWGDVVCLKEVTCFYVAIRQTGDLEPYCGQLEEHCPTNLHALYSDF